ncbi:hydrolase [Porphyromonas crevioricanis]|uniref:Octanoyltransferase n=1 Tax=Porphyromonas crevioricanis TaxID=393921 RepID=A0AB34PHC5_9PORP|nr:lipoyl(octanoyl) transferase LipB [Porphyromonas crevioricanis]KGN90348.1 hydrolase [Porphyromonas crevioricanis]KGN95311.1 hydrolase [Porphyromonas crevioricanis]
MPRIIVLGSGTSTGVPEVGCHCAVCSSTDPADKRLRTSVLYITDSGKRILIDCSPDFRQQALRVGLDRLDAIVLTHEHYDHIGGLDDLRTISWDKPLPIYAEERVLAAIRHRLHYYFRKNPYPGSPQLDLYPIHPGIPFEAADMEILPIRVMHAGLPILAYRLGDFAFVTDLKTISPVSLKSLQGLSLLLLNGLRHKPHLSHQTIDEAIDLIARVGHPKAYITHLSHHAPLMAEMSHFLPEGVVASYDGLEESLPKSPYRYADCGEMPYDEALDVQRSLFDALLKAKAMNRPTHSVLMFCEHEPVLTIGRHGDKANLLADSLQLSNRHIRVHTVDRGGDITYHGPGQITGYPVFDLEMFGLGIKRYISLLESCIIELLQGYGIEAAPVPGATGVWIDVAEPSKMRKICAIGVRSSRYVVMHGFALNVNTDLSYFSLINPCGFTDKGVTSMARELGYSPDIEEVKRRLQQIFHCRFSALMQAVTPPMI